MEDEKRWVRGKKKRTDEDNEAFGRAIAHYLYVEGERLEEAADLFVNHYYEYVSFSLGLRLLTSGLVRARVGDRGDGISRSSDWTESPGR